MIACQSLRRSLLSIFGELLWRSSFFRVSRLGTGRLPGHRPVRSGRYFFLDDADREAVQAKRRAHHRLGYAVQLTSVRFSGRFMADPR
ncbi:DUF4158 domain-containing protein [Streptomyces sp. NPDC054765]